MGLCQSSSSKTSTTPPPPPPFAPSPSPMPMPINPNVSQLPVPTILKDPTTQNQYQNSNQFETSPKPPAMSSNKSSLKKRKARRDTDGSNNLAPAPSKLVSPLFSSPTAYLRSSFRKGPIVEETLDEEDEEELGDSDLDGSFCSGMFAVPPAAINPSTPNPFQSVITSPKPPQASPIRKIFDYLRGSSDETLVPGHEPVLEVNEPVWVVQPKVSEEKKINDHKHPHAKKKLKVTK